MFTEPLDTRHWATRLSARLPDARVATAILALTWTFALTRAWIADDAVITVRCIDNLLNGYGLRWNTSERVQAFTHPLWMLLLVVPMASGLGWYWSLLGAGLVTSALAAFSLVRVSRPSPATVLACATLAFSGAFVDFSTSGLENPLTNALLILLVATTPTGHFERRDLQRLGLLTALLAMTRLDAVLLALPCCALALASTYRRLRLASALTFLVAMAPLWAWECFSVIYYGFPFPNTAYAKLNTDLAFSTSLGMAFDYYRFTLLHDPWTLLGALLLAVVACRYRASPATAPFVAGALLYYGYVAWIGGDFMGGRFLVAPLVLLAAVVASAHVRIPERTGRRAGLLAAITGALCLLVPAETNPPDYGGVINERTQAARRTALFAVLGSGSTELDHPLLRRGAEWRVQAASAAEQGSPFVRHGHAVGLLGLASGPRVHIVDHLALTDPLLARLPAAFDPRPRPGHFERMGQWSSPAPVTTDCAAGHTVCRFWREYEQTLKSNRCELSDPALCRYWSELRLVTEGTLFSAARWSAIFRLNLGASDGLIDRPYYRDAVLSPPEALP